MSHIKTLVLLTCFTLIVSSCFLDKPALWDGPTLTQPRDQLTVQDLRADSTYSFMDMSYFAKPEWADKALDDFSGTITFHDTEMIFPIERAYYPGENLFPGFTIGFISHQGELIPTQKNRINTMNQSESLWDVVVGTGAVWHEETDGEWSRASFPLTLTDRYIGPARNCVATFVFKSDAASNVYMQCSQETADLNDLQVGNIRATLQAQFDPELNTDSAQVVEMHRQFKSRKLPVYPLSTIDSNNEISDNFEESLFTNAPTSLGAVLIDGKLYAHPPQTRHGQYPYPGEMRHGVYSVTKSMAGTLSLLYFAERYSADIFDELITDYVPSLADHPGWQGVTFSHTLNMVTGTVGSERAEHLFEILIKARSAEESIQNIATLGNTPSAPGETFNYASTNLFVLSYALQNYVEEKEGRQINYWDIIHENVLAPIGAEYFTLRQTLEIDGSKGIPILAYGALPTLDEAAKISLLFTNEGNYQGKQLLHREKTREALGRTTWAGYSTDNDYRGSRYRHGYWSTDVRTNKCTVDVTYMLGYGGNYVLFLPSNTVIIRFMDEYDLNFSDLVESVEKVKSSC
jgi:CubicO group peptidase (beta-lactamase class C family)